MKRTLIILSFLLSFLLSFSQQRTISDKTVNAQTAVSVHERVVSYDLLNSNAALKTYVAYYDASGAQVGEENFNIADVISSGSKTALVDALEAAVGEVAEAKLIIGTLTTAKIEYTTTGDDWGIFQINDNLVGEFNNIFSLMASAGDYSSPVDKTVQTIADQTRYNAFAGPLVQLGSYILLPYRSGTNHLQNGQIRFIFYNALTDTWADRETFQTPGSDEDYRDAKGGVLGGEKIILFTTKYKPSTDEVYSMGYFLSESLGTNDWDNYVSTPMPTGIDRGVTHGDVIESDTPGTYYATAYGASSDLTLWEIWLWKIVYASGGVTITRIPVYSGSDKISESAMVRLGGGRFMILSRDENKHTLWQFNSSDGGETWTSPMATDWGTGATGGGMSIIVPSRPIMLNGSLVTLAFNRLTDWIQISKVDPDDVFADPTAYNPVNYEPCDNLGYQWMSEVPGYTDRLLVIWCEEHGGLASTNSAIIYGRVDDFSAF